MSRGSTVSYVCEVLVDELWAMYFCPTNCEMAASMWQPAKPWVLNYLPIHLEVLCCMHPARGDKFLLHCMLISDNISWEQYLRIVIRKREIRFGFCTHQCHTRMSNKFFQCIIGKFIIIMIINLSATKDTTKPCIYLMEFTVKYEVFHDFNTNHCKYRTLFNAAVLNIGFILAFM